MRLGVCKAETKIKRRLAIAALNGAQVKETPGRYFKKDRMIALQKALGEPDGFGLTSMGIGPMVHLRNRRLDKMDRRSKRNHDRLQHGLVTILIPIGGWGRSMAKGNDCMTRESMSKSKTLAPSWTLISVEVALLDRHMRRRLL